MTATEKLWENPQIGDVLTMSDGRTRTVSAVWAFDLSWTYLNRHNLRRGISCSIRQWQDVAVDEVAKGGSYVRAGGEA